MTIVVPPRLMPTAMLIGGEWREASDGATIDVVNPATGEAFAVVPSGSVDDGRAAADAAAAAAKSWRRAAPRERSEILRRGFELMLAHADDLAMLISLENGKTLADAYGELTYAAEFFRWYAEEAVRLAGSVQTAPGGANRILVLREPIGVSVLVTPWNFPAAMATRKIAPALAAGCTVVVKPASDAPLTTLAIAELLRQAGAPPGVVNVVPSRRSSAVVSGLLDHPAVRKLSFTGSTEVGRVLLAEASKRVISASMELGGNAPFLVLADADLDAAVAGAMIAKMRNGGEACTAANRFYVHESLASEFSRRLAVAMAGLRIGPGTDRDSQLGPLINAAAVDKCAELVDDAVERGALLRSGGQRVDAPGYFYPATVLDCVAPGSRILQEEIFGPVAPIVHFTDVDDAIHMANDTEFGLVAYLYTRDLSVGLRVCESLESGMIGLNRGLVSDPAAPFGGSKQSGLGREGGHDGMLEYTETKYIATDW